MGIAVISLANAGAAAVTNTAAVKHAQAWTAGPELPIWAIFGAVLFVFFVGIAIAQAVRAVAERLPERKKAQAEFTRMLCDQLWKHTDFVTNTFAERMRQDPNDTITLHVLIRNLREDLAAPGYFIDQMLSHPPSDWPDYPLFSAFTAWAGRIKSMASQLADVQQALVFPPGKDAADKYREQMLVYKFLTERTIISRSVSQLRADAFTLCEAAKETLKKAAKTSSFAITKKPDDHEEAGHAACPCCRHKHEHIKIEQPDHLHLAPLPIPPKPPEPKPPAPPPAVACRCVVPAICLCTRCTCSCACTPALPAPAKAD